MPLGNLKHITIKKRLTLLILLAVVAIMAIAGVVRIFLLKQDIQSRQDSEIAMVSALALESLVEPLWTYNDNGLKSVGDSLFKDAAVGTVMITGTNGDILYQRSIQSPVYDPSRLTVVRREIVKQDLTLGRVSIGFTDYYNQLELRNQIILILVSILLTCAVLWLLIAFIAGMVTKPLYELSAGAEKIADGNFAMRITINSQDEVGWLAEKFNSMTENIEEMMRERQVQYEQLTAAHEELTAGEEELRAQYFELNRMNDDLTAQNAVLEALQETAAGWMSQTDMDLMLGAILAKATQIAGTPHGEIALLNEKEMMMEVVAGAGLFARHTGFSIPANTGLTGAIFSTGQPRTIRNYNVWDRRHPDPALDEIRCFAQVPIRRNAGVVGVIGVAFTSEECSFQDRQLAMLDRFAELASIAVENARKISELENSRRTIEEIFNAASDGIVVNDGETGEILAVNHKMTEMFGYTEEEFKQQGIVLIAGPAYHEQALAIIRKTVREGTQLHERETADRSGRRFTVEINAARAVIDGKVCCLALMRDITVRKQMEIQMEYLRLRDPLTGAYNRAYFETELLRIQLGADQGTGVFVCDVDGLKLINDTLGHRQGDELLRNVADLLRAGIELPDFVARIGGDEFTMIMNGPTKARMEKIDRKIRRKVDAYNKENPHLPLSLSIGWALAEEGTDIEAAFKTADNNMYRQKMHQSQSIHSSIVRIMMKALEEKDHITEGHADRLGDLMEEMGEILLLPRGIVADLRLLAKFHDIGKVGIPDSILTKPGRLTEDEMAVMRQHCEIGYRIAKSSPNLAPIADWILKHQEHWDGGGYPLGISGEDIPLQCRILGIADAFVAMINDRPYRTAMNVEDALAEIDRCAGKQFDPALARHFIELVNRRVSDNGGFGRDLSQLM
ncbi:MAG: diguanylate cyclase [Negativicutes bacterium]|nr:diguanylate cyclase [Negativicutes bacterium]